MSDAVNRRVDFDLSAPGRVLLAVLSVAAGAIHLVMVPSHFDESVVEGFGFAAAGWFQLGAAWLIVTRPSRLILRVTLLVNLALIATWILSRTTGLPLGAHAWHAETVAFVDGACVAMEAALVIACGVLATRPSFGREWSMSPVVFGAVVPVAVIALATAALASPSARDHAGASHGDHAAAGSHGDMDHGHGEGGDDLGLSELENGHQHATGEIELDRPTQSALTAQLAGTNVLVQQYPTIAAAEAAGYRRVGPYIPGLGTHYMNIGNFLGGRSDGLIGPENSADPMLIFDGLGADAPLAGFMYYLGGSSEPEGFVGPNDHWHYHTNICVVYGADGIEIPFGADQVVTEAACDSVDGNLIETSGYMLHVWTVPGYESDRGTFSEINPELKCPDGTYYMIPWQEFGFTDNACRSEN